MAGMDPEIRFLGCHPLGVMDIPKKIHRKMVVSWDVDGGLYGILYGIYGSFWEFVRVCELENGHRNSREFSK